MNAAQLALPLLPAVLVVAAIAASFADVQPSALRVLVTAVVAVSAPLYWPGRAATSWGTALRILAWSFGGACLAAIVLQAAGGGRQPVGRMLPACAMLMLMLFATYVFVAVLERRLCASAVDAQSAREIAGRTAVFALALLGSLPLWFGPAGELIARRVPWVLDGVMAMSPLTHLAVASGNDLLRNEWFYRHSNLAALRISYPGLLAIALGYICTTLGVCALFFALPRGRPMTFQPTP